ncbi:hypothetical protein DMI66_06130 [Escherichia coli]|nr:hypothetical protein [Escherichia coli]
MRAIRFTIMAAGLPKARFRRHATARAERGERYDQILAFAYPDNSLSRWGRHVQPARCCPKQKRLAEKCRSGGACYKMKWGITNLTCLRSAA